jgi:trehalose-phosphatase
VFENRGFALAMRHVSVASSSAREASLRFVRMVRELDTERTLEILYGDGVVEARVAGWHKGDAICHVLREHESVDALAIYIGNDVTDEDAFEAVCSWAEARHEETPWFLGWDDDEPDPAPRELTILVSEQPRPTRASLFVRSPSEVYEFLASLAAIASALL